MSGATKVWLVDGVGASQSRSGVAVGSRSPRFGICTPLQMEPSSPLRAVDFELLSDHALWALNTCWNRRRLLRIVDKTLSRDPQVVHRLGACQNPWLFDFGSDGLEGGQCFDLVRDISAVAERG